MKHLLFICALALVIQSCGNTKNLKVESIDFLTLDYNPDAPNNIGSVIPGGVCAQMETGELICLKNNSHFESSDNVNFDIKDQEIRVVAMPTSYTDVKVPVMLRMTGKNDFEVVTFDTLYLNFNAGISLGNKPYTANSGNNGKNGGTAALFRDGKDGDQGINGENGLSGNSYDIHIWKDSNAYFIHVMNLTTGVVGKYQIRGSQPLEISASGGNGGNGGKGGNGGDGKDGEVVNGKQKGVGNGGNGGFGGNGGNGGNGGSIRVVLHSSAADFRPLLKLSAQAGFGGDGGTGGTGGRPGKPLAGQYPPRTGANGGNGQRGFSGQFGQITIIDEAFAIEGFK